MTKLLIVISLFVLAPQVIIQAQSNTIDLSLYKGAKKIYFSKEFLEKYLDSSEKKSINALKDAWEFKNLREIDQHQKKELFQILDRLKFTPIKAKAIFERDHLCLFFEFEKSSDSSAILIMPGAPERIGIIYKFRKSGENMILGEEISPRFRVQGLYEIFSLP